MRQSERPVDLLIVGAGPAGLMAAIAAARAGRTVAVLEQLDKPGRKLLATGGGRCNLTNRQPPQRFIRRFGESRQRFLKAALRSLDAAGLEEFFQARGVALVCEDGFHVFPRSQRAGDVLQVLLDECRRLGVTVRTATAVRSLERGPHGLRGVRTDEGVISAAAVLIAAGGVSYPKLGATGSGYRLARQAGHAVVAPVPGLVGLHTVERWPGECSGIVLPACRLCIDQPPQAKRIATDGDVLFTHQGISGPAVLDISGTVARQLEAQGEVLMRLNPLPDITPEAWRERFELWRRADGKKQLVTLLASLLARAVVEALCAQAGVVPSVRVGELLRADREKLIRVFGGVPLTITATAGFGSAMVTAGGVALDEVEPHTLQSRLLPGLFFAGEVLDIDGPCGGYNLQWAFSSGWLAGSSVR